MAEYVRYRMAAAKVGVTMALLSVIGGIAEKAGARPPANAHEAAAVDYLKLTGISGNVAKQFVKLEHKLQSVLSEIDHKLSKSYYDKRASNNTFLKIDKANSEFLKIDLASVNFLKIDAANLNFLKIREAALNYLKIDGTATDSNKLGGLTPDRFFQGHGNVTTGEMSISDGTSTPTFMMGDGSVRVLIALMPPGQQGGPSPQVTLENNTAESLNFTFNGGVLSSDGSTTALAPGARSNLLPAVQKGTQPGGQLDVQIFGASGKAWTLTISNIPAAGNMHTFVGQLLNSQPS
jgi:hypothetical protein